MKVIVSTVVSLGILCTAGAQTLREQIVKMDADASKALMKRDMKAFVKSLKGTVTKDFVYIEEGRKMSFDQMSSTMAMGLGSLTKVTRATTKLVSLTETGTKASGKTTHFMTATMMGPDKKSHVMDFVGTSTDTYVKLGGKWKMSIMDWKNDSMKMDGHPMDPSKMR